MLPRYDLGPRTNFPIMCRLAVSATPGLKFKSSYIKYKRKRKLIKLEGGAVDTK